MAVAHTWIVSLCIQPLNIGKKCDSVCVPIRMVWQIRSHILLKTNLCDHLERMQPNKINYLFTFHNTWHFNFVTLAFETKISVQNWTYKMQAIWINLSCRDTEHTQWYIAAQHTIMYILLCIYAGVSREKQFSWAPRISDTVFKTYYTNGSGIQKFISIFVTPSFNWFDTLLLKCLLLD